MSFKKGFDKTAGPKSFWNNAKDLDKAGLKVLALPAAYHGYKAIKDKDSGSALAAGADLAGLALLHHAVNKGH